MKNRYVDGFRTSEEKTLEIFKYFALDTNATSAAREIGLSAKVVKAAYMALRKRILENYKSRDAEIFRSCGIDPAFLLSRNPVYDLRKSPFKNFPMLRITIKTGNDFVVICDILTLTDKGFLKMIQDNLCKLHYGKKIVGFGFVKLNFKAVRLNFKPFQNMILRTEPKYITGSQILVNNFWDFMYERMRKLNGFDYKFYHLHMKETEWRYNHLNRQQYPANVFDRLKEKLEIESQRNQFEEILNTVSERPLLIREST